MYCTKCGNELLPNANFCTRCGAQAIKTAANPVLPTVAVATGATLGSILLQRLKQAVIWQLQQQVMANATRPCGNNFWSSTTASGNDNGSSGYVDVGGYIVGYDR